MNTVGLTLVNFGFSIIVLLSLDFNEFFKNSLSSYLKYVLKVFSFIGVNSYSIYLWHLNAKNISTFLFSFNSNFNTFTYITLSIVIGIIMSYLIEKPFLKIRDCAIDKITLNNTEYKK